MFEKGQAISLDFVMAAFIFMILVVAINSLWATNIVEIENRSTIHRMTSRARLVSDQLVNSWGYPISWESDIANAESIGLANVSRPRRLSQAKVDAFFAADYATLVEKLGMEGYYCNFYLLKTDETEVSSVRAGDFNGTYLTVEERVIRIGSDRRIIRIEAWV